MSNAKHTWVIDEEDNLIHANDDRHTVICSFPVTLKNPSVKADALKIAAAPELLEALIEASEWVSEYVSQMRAYTISDEAAKSLRRIRAAIAKATGEQA